LDWKCFISNLFSPTALNSLNTSLSLQLTRTVNKPAQQINNYFNLLLSIKERAPSRNCKIATILQYGRNPLDIGKTSGAS
jgi:hypothetical protein